MPTDPFAVARRPLQYAGGTLDRAAKQRRDPKWVAAAFGSPSARFVPVWQARTLFADLTSEPRRPVVQQLDRDAAGWALEATTDPVFLGIDPDGAPFFALDVSAIEDPTPHLTADGQGFVDVRGLGPLLSAPEAALAIYARGMVHWHETARYCGRCGHATIQGEGGHVRLCGNQACGRSHHPRTDPAVIMLVESPPDHDGPPKCLLGRNPNWAPGVHSTLAGFVEIGETLEQAVAREVMEEVGVPVRDVRAVTSQPWPFPSSIMLGYSAVAEQMEVTPDPDEIASAIWVTAEEMEDFGEWGDEGEGLKLPRRDSIARFLVESWRARVMARG